MEKIIYMDNAATTRTDSEVRREMMPFFSERYSNPSGVYRFAQENKKELERNREKISKIIHASAEEIYFTSGGTESDNWAIKGIAEAYSFKGRHIITSRVEHHAVLHTCRYLEDNGYEVSYVDVDEYGVVKIPHLKKLIRPDTILISIMTANNEVGSIQPIEQIGKIARENHICFHTDAVQAFGHIPIDVKAMNIDLLSASGHKFCGPKGVGFLYVNKEHGIDSFLHGGAQENKKRAGTYNVPGIVGMGKAAELAGEHMKERMLIEQQMRDYMISKILSRVPYTRLNGAVKNRLPNNMNFSFQFINGESLLFMLDELGICASAGSACTAGLPEPSHVLMAMGLPEEIAFASLRLTISHETTKEDADYVIHAIIQSVETLRKYSDTYLEYTGAKR